MLLITYKPNNLPPEPWNKGKLVGPKPPFKLEEIWAIRIRRPTASWPGAEIRNYHRKRPLDKSAFGERQLCDAHHCRQPPASRPLLTHTVAAPLGPC